MSLNLVLTALVLSFASGFTGLFFSRESLAGRFLSAVLITAGTLAGLAGAGMAFTEGADCRFFSWPAAGNFIIGMDALSAFFLFPVLIIGCLGSLYGLKYWEQKFHKENGRMLQVFWGILVSGMILLIISRHALGFLLGWEMMAISAFFLITAEHHNPETGKSGSIYLAATHISSLTLLGLFACWKHFTGSFELVPAPELSSSAMNILFILTLIGFGMKAGIFPLHFWLPGAHANGPSHVSAIMSGVVLKMGIYGIIRMIFLMPEPPFMWGGILLVLGSISCILGVVSAICQHDLKRLLAYHSVENIGIIVMGLGLAIAGISAHRPELYIPGIAGALLHVWNHSLFKSLLFMGAGSVLHSTGTRLMDRLGGLGKAMPATAFFFLIGAAAICGLPPLNGFISELFIYTGLFSSVLSDETGKITAAVMAAPVLAMTGALAVACFIKVFGVVFSGSGRTGDAEKARESHVLMIVPMGILAAACLFIGLFPAAAAHATDAVSAVLLKGQHFIRMKDVLPLGIISAVLCGFFLFTAACVLLTRKFIRNRTKRTCTWDCGYTAVSSRVQYTAASFAGMIVELFGWFTKPSVKQPELSEQFPADSEIHRHVSDAVLDRTLYPVFHKTENLFRWFQRFQQGIIQQYILYMLAAALILLATVPFGNLIKTAAGN